MSGKNYHAFSLIELMIVMALSALLVTLVLVNTKQYNYTIVSAELKALRSACTYLRSKAMLLGTEQTLQFNPKKNQYVFDESVYQLPRCVQLGSISNLTGPPASPCKLVTRATTFKNDRIVFYPTGIISSGTVYLTDTEKSIQYALSCAVSQYSFLRLYRYAKKWKLLS